MKIITHNITFRNLTVRDLVVGYHDGKTSEGNYQTLCRKCNREKSAK